MEKKKRTRVKNRDKSRDYVDNVLLCEEVVKFRDRVIAAKELGHYLDDDPEEENLVYDRPKIPEYIGKSIMDIAKRRSMERGFINYPYRDEMVCDGIENCLRYIDNFNPAVTTNPFAYFSQIIYFAFIRRILKEEKQKYVKFKAMVDTSWVTQSEDGISTHAKAAPDDHSMEYINQFIKKFEDSKRKPLKKKKPKKVIDTSNTVFDSVVNVLETTYEDSTNN